MYRAIALHARQPGSVNHDSLLLLKPEVSGESELTCRHIGPEQNLFRLERVLPDTSGALATLNPAGP